MGTLRFLPPTREIEQAAADGAEDFLFEVWLRAKDQTPVDTSRLVNSARYRWFKGRKQGAVWFDTPYAVAVHEIMEARHPVGKAKYLEDPFWAMAPYAMDYIGDAIQAFLTGRPMGDRGITA